MDRSATLSAALKRRSPLLKQGAPTDSNQPGFGLPVFVGSRKRDRLRSAEKTAFERVA
jgi:hypothetical protein